MMTHSGPPSGHVGPSADHAAKKGHATSTRSPRRRLRRALGVTGTVLLTVLTLATMLVAGALATACPRPCPPVSLTASRPAALTWRPHPRLTRGTAARF